jgi:phage N-6-adenine-methyltransferase
MAVEGSNVHFSTGKDDWETPDNLFEAYNERYHFVLDAAANQINHKCGVWFGPGGIHEDALIVSWQPFLEHGSIWLNPPYSRGLQSKFIRKAAVERDEYAIAKGGWDATSKIVCLLPARTDTKLFHEIIFPNAHIEFLKGRVKFKGAAAGAPFPSMIVVF